MKKRLTVLLTLLLVLTLMLSACGESASESNEATSGDTTVVACVNGTDILYSEFAAQMVSVESIYSSLSGTLSSDEINKKLDAEAKTVLNNLINQVILQQKTEEYNITLTEEDEDEVQAAWTAVREKIAASVKANYAAYGYSDEDLEALVEIALTSTSVSEEQVVGSVRTSILTEKLRSAVVAEAAVADEAVEELYNQLLTEQKTEYDNDLTAFEADMLGKTVVVYIPDTYRVIHEMKLTVSDEVQVLLLQLKEYDTEENTSYEDMLASEQAVMLNLIDEIRSSCAQGEDFTAIYETYLKGESPKLNYITENSLRFSGEYYNAAMSIPAEGKLSESQIQQDYSYTLLYWADTLNAGEVPLEEVYDQLYQQLLEEQQDLYWSETQARWYEEAEITIDESLISYTS